ncbi:MAG: phosphatase, partial [Microbacterium sp.]
MSIIENHRRSLPLAEHARGKRLGVTCQLKCADACTNPECNTSQNPTFQEVAQAALSRRALLGMGAAGAIAIALG